MQNRRSKILLAFILLMTLLTFWPVLNAPFISMDDPVTVINNTATRHLNGNNLRTIFTSLINQIYIPLTTLSFALEYHFFQLNPFAFHLTNLCLHLMITTLIFLLAQRLNLSLSASALATLLFALHPLHTEPVVWVSSRKDVLYTLFYLLALHQYLQYQAQPGTSIKNKNFLLANLFGVFSMLAKPMALSLPLILLLCDWLRENRISKARLGEKIPLMLFLAAIGWVSFWANARPHQIIANQGILIWLWTGTFYIRQFFWPHLLTPLYVLPQPITLANSEYLLSILLSGLLLVAIYRFRQNRLFIFAVLYYILSIFFVLRFHNDVDVVMPVADRFMYLPSLGFCLWLGQESDRLFLWLKRRSCYQAWVYLSALGTILIILASRTFAYCSLWNDERTLWSTAIQISPQAFYAYRNRAQTFLEQGNPEQAISDFSQAVKILPDFAPAYFNRATAYRAMGKWELAIKDYSRAIELDPNYPDPYNNRAVVYKILGKPQRTLADLDKYISLAPQYPEAYFNRGMIHLELHNYPQATDDFTRFIAHYPDEPKGYFFRAMAYLGQLKKIKPAETSSRL